jgi:Ca-activated chloride channel family protein
VLALDWPYMLLLAPLPWFFWRLYPAASSEQAALRAPFFTTWQELHDSSEPAITSSPRVRGFVLLLIWLALLLAMSRPSWIGEPISLPASGRDLLIAVDISGSMQVEDMRVGQNNVRRIDSVKQVVGSFIERRRGDRLGLILFGSNAYLQAPLTFDTETVRRFLLEAQLGFAGRETAIGDAIGLAVKRLRDDAAADRVLILLTDGANTSGEVQPLQAAEFAARDGLTVYTVGVGADEMMVQDFFGSRVVNPSADLDEDTLRSIADQTGGRYFRARDAKGLEKIYEILDELEPVESDVEIIRPVDELFHWPMGIAYLFAFLAAAFTIRPFKVRGLAS